MSRKIIINRTVIFEPDKKTVSGKKNTVRLSASATLCMELLIEKAGELVTHQQLYDFAWRRFGMEPTATSLYQNISNLRRALVCTGIRDETIRTMPRRGFILSPRTEVVRESPRSAAASTDMQTPPDTDRAVEDSHPDTAHSEKNSAEGEKQSRKKGCRVLSRPLFFCFTAIAVTVLTESFLLYGPPAGRVQTYYTPVMSDVSGCHVFTNPDSGLSEMPLDKNIMDLLSDCRNQAYLYITTYKNSERTSVISCQNALGTPKRANCHSYYFIEHIKSD
ncbi:winged helix-turn-helix domain-containing protein [Pantoea ananatis]|uniref:winged helix-turn-helix domain-containing protein n=1 Tax=Pantoea ananas TaxID=553 RepID=UPI00301774D3